MEFNIATQSTDGIEFISANGRLVELDGFADLKFFYYKDDKYYSVCELTTGGRVAGGFKLKEAKRQAIKMLERMGAVKTKLAIRKMLALYGQANGGQANK